MLSSPSLRIPVPAQKFEKLFVHESREAAENFLQRYKLATDSTPLLIPFKTDKNVIRFLKPSDGDPTKAGCIRIMGARNELRDKKRGEKFVDWFNRELLGRDFAPHLNDLEGDNVLLEENGLIVIYQRVKQEGGGKNIGAAFAEFFRAEKDHLIKQIKEAKSNDEVEPNIGRFTQGLTLLGMEIDIAAGMTYFIKNGEVFRQTFREGASEQIVNYLHAESIEAEKAQEVRINYNKTPNNHVGSFLKDWAKGTVFAAITALGAGFITLVLLIIVIAAPIAAFIAAPIAGVTFIGLSGAAFYKASKDNKKTIDFGNPEFETIEPEKQKNSILNKLKFYLLMVLAYVRGKPSETKQPVNQVAQSVQNEIAPVQPSVIPVKSPLTEPAKLTSDKQNPIPRVMPVHTTEERSSIPVMQVTPTRTVELPKRAAVKNKGPAFFKGVGENLKEVGKKFGKVVESSLKYQAHTFYSPMY